MLLVGVLLLLPPLAPSAPAQDGCSIHTITGDWGFGAQGKSLIAAATPDPATLHLPGAVLPGAFAGRVIISKDGSFNGYYWMNLAGGVISGTVPVPFTGAVTVNPDCTGTWDYDVVMPGSPPVNVVERFAIVDQGRELRSISWSTAIPTFAWTLVARRIQGRCTPGLVQGAYVLQYGGHTLVPGLPPPMPNPALLASAGLFDFAVDIGGAMSGRMLHKVGPVTMEVPFTGTFTVAADCAVTMTAAVPGMGEVTASGILVENAQRGYGVPMWVMTPSGPEFEQPMYCELVRMKGR
jgi:hypothetical protein